MNLKSKISCQVLTIVLVLVTTTAQELHTVHRSINTQQILLLPFYFLE